MNQGQTVDVVKGVGTIKTGKTVQSLDFEECAVGTGKGARGNYMSRVQDRIQGSSRLFPLIGPSLSCS